MPRRAGIGDHRDVPAFPAGICRVGGGLEDYQGTVVRLEEGLSEIGRAVGERHAGGDPGLGRDRLALLIETICATGIRGNEVRYITVEAAGTGVAQIAMKG